MLQPFIKKALIIGLLFLSICSLAACSAKPSTDNSTAMENYSISSAKIENTLPTRLLNLDFLANQNQLYLDSIWLSPEQLMILTADAGGSADENDSAKQNLSLYIFNTGDDTLSLIYQGKHNGGTLEALSDNRVAIQSGTGILILNYTTGKVTKDFSLNVASEQSTDAAISPTGDLIACNDDKGYIRILDLDGNEVNKTDPKTLGYNWLSTPTWSKDGNALAFFCGYEQYGVDAIGILQTNNLTKPYVLNYEKSNDSFPAWPNDPNTILVLNNFHIPNVKSSIQVIGWQKNEPINNFAIPSGINYASLAYANPTDDIYYLMSNSNLFLVTKKSEKLNRINPANTAVNEDNICFSADAKRVAINKTDENGLLTGIYIIDLS